jgi:predicted phosphodiesterase
MSRRDVLGRLAMVAAVPLVGSCGIDRLVQPTSRIRRLNTVSSVVSTPIPLIVAGDPHFSASTVAYQIAGQIKARLDADPLAWAVYAGDMVANGTAAEFRDYASKALDPMLDRVLAVVGNHDQKDAANRQAQSYFAYFGSRAGEPGKGYYLKTFGDTWVGFFLNSQWGVAEQAAWLAAELPNYADRHIFAVLHQPYMCAPCNHNGTKVTMNWPGFNGMGQIWILLEQNGAEFLLSGHVHRWERFPRMLRDPSNPFTGIVSDQGVRQFVSGTGGTATMPAWTPASPHPHIEKYVQARGPSEFVLHQNHYEWKLTDYSSGSMLDSGTQVCRKTIVPPEGEPEEPPACS